MTNTVFSTRKKSIKMIKPLEDKVVIEPIVEAEKKSASGLIITTTEKEKPTEGIVVAVGTGATFADGTKMTIDLSVGDKVIYSKYSGNEVEHDGKKLVILPYRDIFAVIA
jgi:chaperonin GroES